MRYTPMMHTIHNCLCLQGIRIWSLGPKGGVPLFLCSGAQTAANISNPRSLEVES